MSKPMFRIEQLISSLLKGSPNDPVYLRVGSSTYGIQAIDNGSIRVKSGKDTQDAAQVVKTLRQYASGTPKGEDTGIAWRIVGVGGGTAIRSVSYSNGKIVVRTLANEGKKMDAEFESPYAGKGSLFKFGGGSDDALGGFTAKELTQSSAIHGDFDHASLNYSGHQNIAARAEESSPDYDASSYDPLSESATPSGYDPVTFEAPKAKKKKKKQESTYKQQHSAAVSKKIREVMNEYERSGMVGRSKPANKSAAVKQAVAVAYSMVNQSYRRSGKRLPAGVKRAEGEHSHPFDAPIGYGPMGPQPFYGNRRRLVRDRWGNLRFIRRRKDGTYMDNVDFGRSLKMDRRRKAKTWAPLGFRDQGDGSLDLLTSLMGAEGTDWDLEFGEDYDVSIPANPTENQEDLLDAFSSYQYYDSEYHDKILNRGLEIADETDFRKLLGVCQQHDGIIDSSHPAEAYIIAIGCYDALRSDSMDAEGTDYSSTVYRVRFQDLNPGAINRDGGMTSLLDTDDPVDYHYRTAERAMEHIDMILDDWSYYDWEELAPRGKRRTWKSGKADMKMMFSPVRLSNVVREAEQAAEDDDLSDYYRFVYEIYDNNGETCYGGAHPIGGYAYASGSNMKEALDSIRSELIGEMEREQRRITKAQSQNTAPRATARRNVAGARIVSVEQFSGFDDDDEETFVEIGADLPADIKFNTAMAAEDVYVHGDDGEARSIRVNKTHARNMSNLGEGATTTVKNQRKGTQHTVKRVGKGFEHAAESNDSVWVLILSTEGMNEMGGVYSSKDNAKQAFTKHLKDLGGNPADVDFDSYKMTVWYDNKDDPSLSYHSIRMYEEKLDSDFEMFGQ